jgi:zinc transporter
MICGFRTDASGATVRIDWDQVNGAVSAAPDGFVWLHLDVSDVRVQRWVSDQPSLTRETKALLLGTESHVPLRVVGDAAMGVVSDLHHDFDDDPSAVGALRVFFDERRLITARRHPLQAVDRLRRTVERGRCELRPLPLIAALLHHLSDAFVTLIHESTVDLDAIEAAILDNAGEGAADLGRVRRQLARLRRHLGPQRLALGALAARPPAWASSEDSATLRDAVSRVDGVGHDLDLAQERARQLQDERAAALAEITNRNLYVLSIFTAVFLPMTLVTGVFGMNVGGLPGLSDPSGFFWTMVLMAVTGGATLVVLKISRIF